MSNSNNNSNPVYVVNRPKKNEWSEYVVVVKVNGVRSEAMTYYTDDRDDAFATMQAMRDALEVSSN